MPVFSVVQVEKLISFECNRAYERPKSTKNFIIKKSENLINEKNNKPTLTIMVTIRNL